MIMKEFIRIKRLRTYKIYFYKLSIENKLILLRFIFRNKLRFNSTIIRRKVRLIIRRFK